MTNETTGAAPEASPSPEEIAASIPDFDPIQEGEETEQAAAEQAPAPEAEAKAAEAERQKMLKRFKLKVDGEEIEEEIDLADEERLIKELQLARAAKKRMAEANEAKRRAYELLQTFEKNPKDVFKRHPDGMKLAEELLLEKIQDEMLTPEQRQVRDMQRRLEAYEKAEAEAKAQAEQAQLQALEQRAAEQYQQTIIQALEKSGLPKTPESARRMAYLLQKNLELGIDLDATDLALEAKREYQSGLSALVKNATPEQLIQLLDQETIKKLRAYDAQQFKARQKFSPTKTSAQSMPPPPPAREKSYQTLEEWQEEVRKRLQRG